MTKKQPLVLVAHPIPSDWLSKLRGQVELAIGPEGGAGFTTELMAQLPQADGLFTLLTDPVTDQILSQAPNLKVVSNMAVGVDNIDLAACTARGIAVGHTPGVLTEGTADLTFAILLSLARNIEQASLDAKQGKWSTWSPTGWLGADLSGKTIGIIGMGKIGQAVARRAKGFGLKIVFHNRSQRPELENEFNARQVELDELLKTSDFVCLHTALTGETKGLINQTALEMMKPTAYLINAARGPAIDQDALVTALKENQIAGAALDVTTPEPLPPDHPLYQLDNCLITPHIGSATHDTRKAMAELACINILDGLAGSRLTHCANPEVYQG